MIALIKRAKTVVFLFLFLVIANTGSAQDATLTNITVSNTRDDLLLYLNLEGAFREEMKKAILSGVPSTF